MRSASFLRVAFCRSLHLGRMGRTGMVVLWVFLLAIQTTRAQEFVTNVSNKGTVAAAFLEIGIGARAVSMGGTYVAESGRMDMIYWNPAGLAYLEGLGVSFSHTEWLAETNHEFFTLAKELPFIRSVAAASIVVLSVPAQPIRTVLMPEGTGETYSAQDYAVSFSVATKLINEFSVGLTTKYINQRIWTESAGQLALDVGVHYKTPLPGLSLGASISNFGPDMQLTGKNLTNIVDPDVVNRGIENIPVEYKTDGFPLPQIFRFGTSYTRALPGRGQVVALASLMHPTGSTESMSVGLEYGFNNLVFFRAGYQNLFERDAISSLTLGAGLQYVLRRRHTFAFDYAYADWTILQKVHRLSLSMLFK